MVVSTMASEHPLEAVTFSVKKIYPDKFPALSTVHVNGAPFATSRQVYPEKRGAQFGRIPGCVCRICEGQSAKNNSKHRGDATGSSEVYWSEALVHSRIPFGLENGEV